MRFQLDNGLRAAVRPSSAAPVVALYLWLDTGSAQEGPNQAGMAHFLEHMLFKGTSRRGVGQCASEIEGLGGDLNAWTSHDETVLHATVAADGWKAALDVLVDMARQPAFDPVELAREQLVVLEEIRGADDEPDNVLTDQVARAMFPDHPYGRPILGTAPSVAAIDAAALRAFWEKGWCARRAVLGVAGDVDPSEVEAEVRRLLGDWHPGDRRPSYVGEARPHKPLLVERDFETALVEMAWNGPRLGHADVPALDVLITALGQGAASLLTARLQLEEAIASDIWSALWARPGGGTLSVGFAPRSGDSHEAVALALEALREVHRRGLSGVAVDRARTSILADFLFGHETVDSQAHDLVWYEAHYGDPAARRVYRDAVAAITPEDVARVAREWLDPEACTIGVIDAGLKPTTLSRAVNKARAARPTPRPRAPSSEVVQGVRVHLLPDDSPVAAVRIAAVGGSLAETPATAGISRAWARMVVAGADDLDATGWAEACDDLAGDIDAVAGRNSLGLRGSFPASAIEDGVALMGRALVAPRFDTDEWERVHEELRDDVRTLVDRPYDVGSAQMWRRLWPGHPWALPPTGGLTSLGRLTTRRLGRWHRAQIARNSLQIAVAGGFDPDGVLEAIAEWVDELPEEHAPLTARDPAPVQTGHAGRRAGREQANVLLGTRGASIRDDDRRALELAASVLGAQGGRLFMQLREARGLAYSVWSWTHIGLDGGVFSAGLATDPARADEARTALRDAIDQLATQPPGEDELARTRRMMAGQVAVSLQRTSSRASQAALGELYGVPWGLEVYRAQLEAVDAEAVSAALRRALASGVVEVTVRPR